MSVGDSPWVSEAWKRVTKMTMVSRNSMFWSGGDGQFQQDS